ncbi:unnamed protein product [Dicrocoelium dendriticum]|nr:unnamed protein product [Dicrocoelium dendriticum]
MWKKRNLTFWDEDSTSFVDISSTGLQLASDNPLPVNGLEVYRELFGSKVNKASSQDKLSPVILKGCEDYLAQPLATCTYCAASSARWLTVGKTNASHQRQRTELAIIRRLLARRLF